jgi:hypothetical protein
MKAKYIFYAVIAISLTAVSCKKDPKSFAFNGKAQKGPYVAGANITVNELNNNFEQTGKSFSSSTSADDGSFTLNSVELETNYALVTANGFYFDEVAGGVSTGTLNLQALTDLSNKSTVNINALTHVIRTRVEKHLEDGKDFATANSLAKDELLSFFFNIQGIQKDFDQLDITQGNDDNAILLAFSVMMMGPFYNPAELVELLTKLRTDFGDNGIIDNPALISQVYNNTSFLTAFSIKENMENKYNAMGISATVPNFQKYINKFVETHGITAYTDFYYPLQAAPSSHNYVSTVKPNVLEKSTTSFNVSDLVIAAISPFDQSVTIRISFDLSDLSNPNDPNPSPPLNWDEWYLRSFVKEFGWSVVDFQPNSYSIKTERQNLLCSLPTQAGPMNLIPINYEGKLVPVTVEYFENGSTTPTFTKNVTFTR